MFKNSLLSFSLIFLFMSGCTVQQTPLNNTTRSSGYNLENTLAIAPQVAAPRHIQSIQLYRSGSPDNPPVIQLGGEEKLILEFDYLGDAAKQFRVEVTHRNRDWQESALAPGFYLSGFKTIYISGGLKSLSQPPSYFHFTYEFPDQQLSFKASGNYLLSIYDYDTDDLLFTLPFFITENEGILETDIEEVFARRQDLRRQSQPFSQYTYPEFVEFPQFDLSFQYVPNQFWGRAQEVEFFDTSTPGQVHFHLSQDQAFISDYTFNLLDLRTLHAGGRQILSVEQGPVPPRVILRRDVQNLDPSFSLAPGSQFGLPSDERNASYASVQFRLETTAAIDSTQRIYILGDFNNWTIREYNRMRYDPRAKWWEGRALIKEGQYAYKYVILRQGEIDDLSLDQSFVPSNQEYITLVYYRDPARNYDRLLQVDRIISN